MTPKINLILGSYGRYKGPKYLVNFVTSLKKFKNIKIILVIEPNIKTEKYLNENQIDYIYFSLEDMKTERFYQNLRYKYYTIILGKYSNLIVNKVILSDITDVYFQNDTFLNSKDLVDFNFFLEPQLIKSCKINSNWINMLKNFPKYDENIANNYISCCGVSIFDYEASKYYCNQMVEIINQKSYIYDQAAHNYLIYTNTFLNYKIFSHYDGPVATLHHDRHNLNFDDENNLINAKKIPYSIVHQYDRCHSKFKETFLSLGLNFDINRKKT